MKRILVALLVSVTIIAQLKAQTPRTPDNPAAVSVWPQVSPFQNHWRMNEAGDKGVAVQYVLNQCNLNVRLTKYTFTVTLWRERDPLHPVYDDGEVTDWSKLEQLEFAISPRDRNDFYTIDSPDQAPYLQYEVTKEARREATWTSAFRYYILDDFFSYYTRNLPPYNGELKVRFFVRYDMEYEGKQYASGMGSHVKGKVSNSQKKVTQITRTLKAIPLKVKSWLTQDKESDGFNLNFEFPSHPADCPYEVTLSFWREKDVLNPQFGDGRIEDFKLMDIMQFSQSTQDPNVIGAVWKNDEDYEMTSEYSVEKSSWQPFSIHLPEALFMYFDRPDVPFEGDTLFVPYYIVYHLSYGGGYVSNETGQLPSVTWKYFDIYQQKIAHVDEDDLSDLFGENQPADSVPTPNPTPQDSTERRTPPTDDTGGKDQPTDDTGGEDQPTDSVPTPNPTPQCDHRYQLVHNPRMYALPLPQPTPQDSTKRPPANHVHYYYLIYTPSCTIIPRETIVPPKELPDTFNIEIGQHRTTFGRNLYDCHISRTAATEGLWAALFPEQEMSRGCSATDATPLRHMNRDQANELVVRLNQHAAQRNLPWLFTVATAKEATKAGYPHEITDNDDDEAFTKDSCFYISATSTLAPSLKVQTRYRITSSYTADCVYPGCDYTTQGPAYHSHRYELAAANRSCQWNEALCNSRNKETEAYMKKLKQWILKGEEEQTVDEQPKYVWYVEDEATKQCAKCQRKEPLPDGGYTHKTFATRREAQEYFDTLNAQ